MAVGGLALPPVFVAAVVALPVWTIAGPLLAVAAGVAGFMVTPPPPGRRPAEPAAAPRASGGVSRGIFDFLNGV